MGFDGQMSFFDSAAKDWDSRIRQRDHRAIEKILEKAELKPGEDILDVGAGTGIMIPYYQRIGVHSVRAVDSSRGMVRVLKKKFPELEVDCQSFTEWEGEGESFDRVVIFNAFPHLQDFEAVFSHSHRLLRKGGQVLIAHSMNRRELDAHHRNKTGVHKDLLPDDDFFRKQFSDKGFTDIKIKDGADYFLATAAKE